MRSPLQPRGLACSQGLEVVRGLRMWWGRSIKCTRKATKVLTRMLVLLLGYSCGVVTSMAFKICWSLWMVFDCPQDCMCPFGLWASAGWSFKNTRLAVSRASHRTGAFLNHRSRFTSSSPTWLPLRVSIALRLDSDHSPRVDAFTCRTKHASDTPMSRISRPSTLRTAHHE
jgi:hypothetical protein